MSIKHRIILSSLCLTLVLLIIAGSRRAPSTDKPVMAEQENRPLPIIVVDPGHGGIDGGTSGADGTLEKDINLQIALKTEQFLRAFGFETVLTRQEDRLLSQNETTIRSQKRADLNNRLAMVKEHELCVLLSIHQNYYQDSQYSGGQVFFSKNNPASKTLAQTIQDRIVTNLQPENTRQIKPVGSEIFLLDQSQCPAVMVECGFMSNLKDLTQLKNKQYQINLAYTIAFALLDFYTQ